MPISEEVFALNRSLSDLKHKHNALDEKLFSLQKIQSVDDLEVSRVKKEKLKLKDAIWRLQASFCPDIIA